MFDLQLHHFTPNGILTLNKFFRAYESYGVVTNINMFCTYFELQKQPKKVKTAEGKFIA